MSNLLRLYLLILTAPTIFLTDGTVTCFTGKQIGHLSSECQNTPEKYTNAPTVTNEKNTSIDSSFIATNLEVDLIDVTDIDMVYNTEKNPIETFKRPLTVSTCGPSSYITQNT